MIWHIFKKDWTLQWRLALAVALTQLVLSGMLWKFASSGQNGASQLVALLCAAAFLARGFLIIETVHQDPLPGVRQDWLVRPIRRSELLAAKCLFTVLVVQGPVFVGDLMESLAGGFSFGASFNVALSRSLYILITFSLPVLALSAVTKNLLEVLTSGVFGLAILGVARVMIVQTGAAQKLIGTGFEWMVETCCLLTILAVTAAILTMQFRRRMTIASRCLAVAGVVALIGIMVVPWQQAAFALQSGLLPTSGAASRVEIAFEANPGPVPIEQRVPFNWRGTAGLRVPLSISGLPADSILADDHFEARLLDSQGVTRAKVQSSEYGFDQLLVGSQGTGPVVLLGWRNPSISQIVSLETSEYIKLKDQKLHMEIDYSMTLMGLAASYAIPAVNGSARLPGIGWCKTHENELGDSIDLNCLNAGPAPDCYSLFLEHTPSGRRNAESYGCNRRDYSPYFVQFFPDALSQFGRGLGMRFHDATGQSHFAVDASDVDDAKVVIRNYRPLDHFTRHITTPEKPLSDWLAK